MPTVVSGLPQNVLAGPWHSREVAGASLGYSDNPTEFLGFRTCHRRHPWPTDTTLAASQLPASSDGDWSWQQLHNKLLKGFWCPQFAPTDITHISFHVEATRKNSVTGSVLTVVMDKRAAAVTTNLCINTEWSSHSSSSQGHLYLRVDWVENHLFVHVNLWMSKDILQSSSVSHKLRKHTDIDSVVSNTHAHDWKSNQMQGKSNKSWKNKYWNSYIRK